ncbi:hypothetical protein JXA40_07865 [bacterium]|nr:hypothetical protein [candidate division CSSED10-310 bacterium]
MLCRKSGVFQSGNRIIISVIAAGIPLFCFATGVLGSGISDADFNSVNRNIPGGVPFGVIRQIAVYKAAEAWGSAFIHSVFPCCDLRGDVIAYQFVFQKNTEEPVPVDRIIHSRKALRERDHAARESLERGKQAIIAAQDRQKTRRSNASTLPLNPQKMDGSEQFQKSHEKMNALHKKLWGTEDFGTILVSARSNCIPVPIISYGLPHLYVRGDIIETLAENEIGGDIKLNRIYMSGPLDMWYEFVNDQTKHVIVDANSEQVLTLSKLIRAMQDRNPLELPPETAGVKWRAVLAASRSPASQRSPVFVLYNDEDENGNYTKKLIPTYAWSCGCAPTAAATAMAYWDNLGPIGGGEWGKYTQWGRLIDYYVDKEALESYQGSDGVYYVWHHSWRNFERPFLIVDLAINMGTTGGMNPGGSTISTRMDDGINAVTLSKGYDRNWSEFFFNDVFERVIVEIGGNRPCVWVIENHALCAWGYDSETVDPVVITYDSNMPLRRDVDKDLGRSIATISPQNPSQEYEDVELIYPDGDEIWICGTTGTIEWHQYEGSLIDTVHLSYSRNGGLDFSVLESGLASSPGTNQYEWQIPPGLDSERVRIRIESWQGPFNMYSEDGSQRNFTLSPVQEPPPPPENIQATDGYECNLVRVTWNESPGADEYLVYRFDLAVSGWQTELVYDDYPLGFEPYRYRVKARNSWGESDFSEGDDGTRKNVPEPATGVEASDGLYPDRVTVAWDGDAPDSEYLLYRDGAPAPGGEWQTGTTYLDAGVIPDEIYFYQVLSRNRCGEGSLSEGDAGWSSTHPGTPTPTPVPPSTATPTVPPTGTGIPSPSATPPECETTGVRLWMPAHEFHPGDLCGCRAIVCNAEDTLLTGYPLFVILDVYGSYFFAPGFNALDFYSVNFHPGETSLDVIPLFIWPENAGSARDILWYAALTDPDITVIYGTMDTWRFGWT